MRIKLQLGNGTTISLPANEIETSLPLSAATAVSGGYVLDQYATLDMRVSSGGYKDGYSVQGLATTSLTWGAATCTYIQGINFTVQFGTWYCDGVNCTHTTAGSSGDYQIYGVHTQIEGVDFYGLAIALPEGFTGSVVCLISAGAVGRQGFTEGGGEPTPPGTGADADGGYGAYDFVSKQAQGSSIPTSPGLPIDPDGYGLHAYTLDPAAYKVLGAALWGIGDAGNSIAFADMWQKWKNFKFNPTAGIISCIRLPDIFTPVRAGLTDTNIKLSGTWAVAGGQFASIAGCKPADVAPIAAAVLSVDIPEQYGSWLDYDGGVEITLDLPFCGRMQVDPNACVGGGIDVEYRCDPCNGNCAAFVFCRDRWGASQLYNVGYGNCALQVPLTGHDDGQVQMLGSFVASSAALAGAAASPVMAAGAVAGAASSMLMRRETTQTVGSAAGSVSYVGNVTPTIIISYAHPVKSPDTLYADTEGQPCEYGGKIGSYTGYTIMHNVDVVIPAASAEEREEIARLLESGVIL